MKGCRYRFELERFVLAGGDADLPSRLELDASIVSDAAVERAHLVSPGLDLPVAVDPQADDDDPRLLLSLREAVVDGAARFERAELEIRIANGDCLAFGIGRLFRPPGWMPSAVRFGGPGAIAIVAPNADALADAIATGFDALGDRDDLLMHRADGRWIATSHRYGLVFPTSLDAGPDTGLDRAAARGQAWPMLRERAAELLGTLDVGVPMLLHRATAADDDDTMASLSAALRARNPDGVLLWIDRHRQGGPIVRHRHGAVAPPDPGLLVAGAGDDDDALIVTARDVLLAPR